MADLPFAPVLLSQRYGDDYRRAAIAGGWTAVATVSKPETWDDGGLLVGVDLSDSRVWIDRPYFTGLPNVGQMAAVCARRIAVGAKAVQVGNEPQLVEEGIPGGSDADRVRAYCAWAMDVRAACTAYNGTADRLLWAPLSISGDWRALLRLPEFVAGARAFGRAAVHAYGTAGEIIDTIDAHRTAFGPGVELWITECNAGAGRAFDADRWGSQDLPIVAQYAAGTGCRSLVLFAWRWDRSPTLPTSVDVAAQPTVLATLRLRFPMSEKVATVIEGIDVSNWQKDINWLEVRRQNPDIQFAICKSSEDDAWKDDGGTDPYFVKNLLAMRDLYDVRGAYHYCNPSVYSPAQSVATLERAIAKVGGLLDDEFIAPDMEDTNVGHPNERLDTWLAEWFALAAEVFGRHAVLYSGHWYMAPHGLLQPDFAARNPLWLASHQDTRPGCPPWEKVWLWQYTGSGSVNGIGGNIDRNRYDGTLEQMRADVRALLIVPPVPEPEPPSEPNVTGALDRLWSSTEHRAEIGETADAVADQEAIVVLKQALGLQ